MSDAGGLSKADMLTAAKRKLKDFEARQKLDSRNSPTSSVISSEPGGLNGLNGRSSCISDDSTVNGDVQSNIYQEQQNGQSPVNGVTNHSISPYQGHLTNGNEWYQAYTQLKSQHDELCAHYSQLHSAYSQINTNGVHVDAENQIAQLQAALSTMVEEKLACQSDLRQTREELEKLKEEVNRRQAQNVEPVKSDMDGNEKRHFLAKIGEKDSLLSALRAELENMRKEVAMSQANLLTVQHERSEAQARVKSLIRDNSSLEQNFQQLKKDMQMKDLYLKQLGAHNVHNSAHPADSNAIEDLHQKVEQLTGEAEILKNEKSRLLAEAATLKSHYAEREHALTQKQVEMAAELDQLHSHRFSSDDRVQQLENQLHLANVEVERLRALASHDASSSQDDHEVFVITEEAVGRRIREAVNAERCQWEKRVEEEQRLREEEVLMKDRAIFESEQARAEVEMKYRLLEERTLESTANGADLLSLSEQLQNEKATVSRAVAQNRELKAQLIETEDRMIVMTGEKLKLELAKQAAEHQVKELTKQLNLEEAGLVSHEKSEKSGKSEKSEKSKSDGNSKYKSPSQKTKSLPTIHEEVLDNATGTVFDEPMEANNRGEAEDVAELQDNLEVFARENAQIRAELQNAMGELSNVRAELRRSNTQNEQMDEIMRQNAEDENQNSIHVELTHAVGRVNDLATENEQLREALNDLNKQFNEERSRAMESERKLDNILGSNRQEKERVELEKAQNDVRSLEQSRYGSELTMESKEVSKESEELWARKELEKRFARAMMQNAELTETIDKLEHINQQLELENDTIADHVVLYQHQRKLIRERLRAKDERLKLMEDEKAKTVARCQELQSVLMTVLSKGGVLKEYEIAKNARKVVRKVSRSYSHCTVDEMSGDEDVIVDGAEDVVPLRSGSSDSPVIVRESPVSEFPLSFSPSSDEARSEVGEQGEKPESINGFEQDASVRRILEIISDISRPVVIANGQLHCTQCIGDLQEL